MQAAQAAVDESARLERALAALDRGRPDDAVKPTAPPPRPRRRRTQPGKRAARGANRNAILALVAGRSGVTAGEVAEATGIVRSTVSPTLARLVSTGAVERVELPGSGVGFRAPAEPAPCRGGGVAAGAVADPRPRGGRLERPRARVTPQPRRRHTHGRARRQGQWASEPLGGQQAFSSNTGASRRRRRRCTPVHRTRRPGRPRSLPRTPT